MLRRREYVSYRKHSQIQGSITELKDINSKKRIVILSQMHKALPIVKLTIRNRLLTWNEMSVGCFSSNYTSFSARDLRSSILGVISVCMKERPHITQILLLIYFFLGVSEAANCMFWLFQLTNMDADIINHLESIGCIPKCICLSISCMIL